MRTIFLVTILILSFAYVSGQNKSDTLKIIDQKVYAIDQDTGYWLSTYTNEAFLDSAFLKQKSQGYGQLTGYFKNGKICMIRELVGIKLLHDIATTYYYFEGGELIYVDEQEKQGPAVSVDSAGTVDYRIKEPSFEVRYYFHNGKRIATSEKGERKTMLLPDERFFDSQSKEGQLLSSAQKYYMLFSVKYK